MSTFRPSHITNPAGLQLGDLTSTVTSPPRHYFVSAYKSNACGEIS